VREPDLDDMIEEVKREIFTRERVYARLMRERKINKHRADWQIDVMRAVLAKLIELNGGRDSAPGILI
jgi:hypothetical protein